MADRLQGCRVAILVADGFEEVELTKPRQALDDAGAETSIVAPKDGTVRSWRFTDWGEEFPVDVPLSDARPGEFDALLLPGGVISPDNLRMDESAMAFASAFFEDDKPVASICHGPWTVIETGFADGRRIASWPSLQTDLLNAGAEWVDQPSVTDGNLTTSRNPDDIPRFTEAMIDLFARQRTPEAA
ncbi:MAG: type 1 glutamine amidotransferase domain-containing protein [Allosphingosinicella sp.]